MNRCALRAVQNIAMTNNAIELCWQKQQAESCRMRHEISITGMKFIVSTRARVHWRSLAGNDDRTRPKWRYTDLWELFRALYRRLVEFILVWIFFSLKI